MKTQINGSRVEQWVVNGQPVMVVVHPRRLGWDLFTAHSSLKIDETFADADRRVGLGGA
jgi:hypothetical protein